MNRAVEQCCDEQVIGRGIHPVDYARAMYEVLLCKHELEVVPTYPGVKAVSISRQRMERIMKLGQGCRRRTPLWCWILVIVLAAVTLPGAAIVSAERTREPARRRSTQREGSQPAAVLKGRGVNGDAGVVGQVVIAAAREAEETEGSEGAKPDVQQEQPRTYAKVYNVADLVVPATPNEPIRLQWNRKQQAWDLILDDAVVRVGPFGNLQPVGRDFNFESLIKLLQANVAPDSWLEKGGIGTVEEFPTTLSLVVSQTEEIHKAIAQQLSRLRDLQAQIVCDIHVLELPTSVKEGFHLEGAANDPIAPAHSRDELNVQPVKLSEEKTAQLLRAAHKHPLAKVVSVRRMAIYSKQHVEVSYNAGDLEYTMPVRATIASNGGIQIDIPEDAGAAEAAITELLTAGESLVLAVSGTTAGWAEADIDRSLLGSLRRFIVGSPVPETVYLVVTPSIPEKAAP